MSLLSRFLSLFFSELRDVRVAVPPRSDFPVRAQAIVEPGRVAALLGERARTDQFWRDNRARWWTVRASPRVPFLLARQLEQAYIDALVRAGS